MNLVPSSLPRPYLVPDEGVWGFVPSSHLVYRDEVRTHTNNPTQKNPLVPRPLVPHQETL